MARVPNQFKKIVGGGTLAAGAIGVPGAFSFGSDVVVLQGIWVTGAILIAEKSGVELDKNTVKQLAVSALSGGALFIGGSKLAGKLFHLLPGPGTLGAIAVNSSLDAFYTFKFLKSVALVFEKYNPDVITSQLLRRSISFFNPLSFLTDVSDMIDCMEVGVDVKSIYYGSCWPSSK